MLDEGQLLESGKPFEAKNSSNIESWCEGAEDWTGFVLYNHLPTINFSISVTLPLKKTLIF